MKLICFLDFVDLPQMPNSEIAIRIASRLRRIRLVSIFFLPFPPVCIVSPVFYCPISK